MKSEYQKRWERCNRQTKHDWPRPISWNDLVTQREREIWVAAAQEAHHHACAHMRRWLDERETHEPS